MRNEIEVMRVIRIPPMGKLVVEVNGRRLESLAQVKQEAVQHRLLAAIGELIVFAGGYQDLVDAGVAPPLASPAGAEATPEQDPPPTGTLDERQAAFLNSLEVELQESEQAPATQSLLGFLSGRGSRNKRSQPEPAESAPPTQVNLVEQIDEILQRHLAADPDLSQRAIHLEQGPGGRLQISVDGTIYHRPGEIEDKQVKVVIKMALKEWESS